jgi:hypothetical protein
MVYIYILELLSNKYYIGKSNKPDIRIDMHINGNGAAWTQKYIPMRVARIISNCDDFDEDKYTIIMMKKYGIDNVRGGSFCNIILDNTHIDTINRMIRSGTNACYGCGSEGHFIKDCTERDDYIKIYKCYDCEKVYDNYNDLIYHRDNMCKKNLLCKKCGKKGHIENDCMDIKEIINNGINMVMNMFDSIWLN